MKHIKYFFLTIFIGNQLFAQPLPGKINVVSLNENAPTSIRAMSAVSDSVVWVGGSRGYIGKTTNGGRTWQWMHPDNEKPDFRSLAAFDSLHAIVANAGSPATIFLTNDGGSHWQKVYFNPDTAVFFDGMVFRNKKDGIIYGDPVHGRFIILKTKDGGKRWKLIPWRKRPKALAGEASFAASNSAIFNLPGTKYLWIGTGGQSARLFLSKNFGGNWKIQSPPILQGKSSAGIFSIAFINKNNGICVGGDYANETVRLNNAVLTKNRGKNWEKPVINPFGYRSCVIYLTSGRLFSTGPSGTDMSKDGGATWTKLSPLGFNVLQKAMRGHTIFLAGKHGEIARLLFPQNIKGDHYSLLKDKE